VAGFAAAGWNVLAVDGCADDPRLPYGMGTEQDLAAAIEQARAVAGPGAEVRSVVADAASIDDMTAVVSDAEGAFGGVDGIIAVAGVNAGGVPFWDMAAEQAEAVLEGNLRSALVAARVGIPALLRRAEPRSGRFVAVASAAASRGLPMLAAYCAAKAGVTGLVRALAVELRGTGVTANAVSPGSTDTPILDESARLYGLESGDVFSLGQPIERLIRAEEVAAAIVWVAGPAASAVTGAALPIDGGLSL
jgi:SDR family mycofactocin-dependent oxidoreductase